MRSVLPALALALLPMIATAQDPGRPFVYVSGFVNYNFFIYDLTNPSAPRELFQWTIEDPELHRGIGAMDGKYFKTGGRYYYVQSFQFNQGSPDADLGAVVFDVTGLPNARPGTSDSVITVATPWLRSQWVLT